MKKVSIGSRPETAVHRKILNFEVHDGTGAIEVAWVARTIIKLDVAGPPGARMRLDSYICALVEAEHEHGSHPV